MLLYNVYYKSKNIFTNMLKDKGIEVARSIETRSSTACMQAKAGDDMIQV